MDTVLSFEHQKILVKRGKRKPGTLTKIEVIEEEIEAVVACGTGLAYHPVPAWAVLSRLVPAEALMLSWISRGCGSASSSLALPLDEETARGLIYSSITLCNEHYTIDQLAERMAEEKRGNWFVRQLRPLERHPFEVFYVLGRIIDAALEELDLTYQDVAEVEIEYTGYTISMIGNRPLWFHSWHVSIKDAQPVIVRKSLGRYSAFPLHIEHV